MSSDTRQSSARRTLDLVGAILAILCFGALLAFAIVWNGGPIPRDWTAEGTSRTVQQGELLLRLWTCFVAFLVCFSPLLVYGAVRLVLTLTGHVGRDS